jgi:hypothetical protein
MAVRARLLLKCRGAVESFGAVCRKQTPAALERVLFFGGLAAIVAGCWMIYRPLGPLVGGALSVWISMLMSLERAETPAPKR